MNWTADMGYSRFPDAPLDPPEFDDHDDEEEVDRDDAAWDDALEGAFEPWGDE